VIRETYYGALFTLLETLGDSAGIKTIDRRVRYLQEMEASELPALFMAVDSQTPVQRRGQPTRHQFTARVFIYAKTANRKTPADIQLNGLLDAVDDLIAPPVGEETQTLGNLVSHCWIDGPIEVFAAKDGEKSAAIVTIQMLIP
jgi:hypothetical protein